MALGGSRVVFPMATCLGREGDAIIRPKRHGGGYVGRVRISRRVF